MVFVVYRASFTSDSCMQGSGFLLDDLLEYHAEYMLILTLTMQSRPHNPRWLEKGRRPYSCSLNLLPACGVGDAGTPSCHWVAQYGWPSGLSRIRASAGMLIILDQNK
ncbi:hypothetical protein VNO77_15571 [Canavalia gladiata]|uniref:Uncharacterized protein n=1 Tax=Canavalia gladiata TaxID=3824 RepID=A0AAN9M0E1_CANGL